MEASALSHASRRGLLARRSPLLRLERDERLVALIRAGHDRAFEALFDRYHSRLLAFCNSMLKSRQDAEDVLQEVFVNAHRAMLADDRKINVRPWLYRIARNRCLNHLRRPVPEGQDSMDVLPHMHGTSTAERVQKREELRGVIRDVHTLPDTQKVALLLREIDQLSYDEIAIAMETTIPAVKSLLVRARISLAESSEARALSCEEVRVTLAEAAEGVGRATGAVRIHLRACEGCASFREQLRDDSKALASIVPVGPLAALKATFIGKLFGGGSSAGSSGTIAAVGGSACAGGTAGGIGALGGALGSKAAAGVATAALLAAGAVEVGQVTGKSEPAAPAAALERTPAATATPAQPQRSADRGATRKRAAAPVAAAAPASERQPDPARSAAQPQSQAESATARTSAPAAAPPSEPVTPTANGSATQTGKGSGSAVVTGGGVSSSPGPSADGSSADGSSGEGTSPTPPPSDGGERPIEVEAPPVEVAPAPVPAPPAP